MDPHRVDLGFKRFAFLPDQFDLTIPTLCVNRPPGAEVQASHVFRLAVRRRLHTEDSVHGAMMTAQKRMEDALAQQTILDIARKVGRKAPAEFNAQVATWMNDRRERKGTASAQTGDDQLIQVTELSD